MSQTNDDDDDVKKTYINYGIDGNTVDGDANYRFVMTKAQVVSTKSMDDDKEKEKV